MSDRAVARGVIGSGFSRIPRHQRSSLQRAVQPDSTRPHLLGLRAKTAAYAGLRPSPYQSLPMQQHMEAHERAELITQHELAGLEEVSRRAMVADARLAAVERELPQEGQELSAATEDRQPQPEHDAVSVTPDRQAATLDQLSIAGSAHRKTLEAPWLKAVTLLAIVSRGTPHRAGFAYQPATGRDAEAGQLGTRHRHDGRRPIGSRSRISARVFHFPRLPRRHAGGEEGGGPMSSRRKDQNGHFGES
jgi:hypothetical protein